MYKKRERCRGCNGRALEKILDLGDMPLAGGFLKPDEILDEEKIPLQLYFCRTCKLVQILHVVDPVLLFQKYYYISSVIPSLRLHFNDYAKFLLENYLVESGAKILEIGCNDGVLLENFTDSDVFTLGVDPSHNVYKFAVDKGLNVLNDFFNISSAKSILEEYGKFDVLTGSNMFAHIDDIIEVIDAAKIILKKDGVFIFEVHYLLDLLKKNQYDTIYHEHLTYYSVLAIKNIFKAHGMKIIDVFHLDMHGGGIRVVTCLENAELEVKNSVDAFILEELNYGLDVLDTYLKFSDNVLLHKNNLLSLLQEIKDGGSKIIGYGAPGRGTILLNYCGITDEILDYIVDISPLRQGMLMPGVHIPIKSTELLSAGKQEYILILAWNYVESILEQEEKIYNAGAKFIVPLPEVTIL